MAQQKIDREAFKLKALEHIRSAKKFWTKWRKAARDDYAFIAGKQWFEEDEARMDRERRPSITFNYSEKMIDAVVGAEVSNRNETTFKARTMQPLPRSNCSTTPRSGSATSATPRTKNPTPSATC
jgi:hypothetical protein